MLWLQIVVFLAVSIAALIATRPLAHKMLDKTIVPTNADRVLHHTAKVTETIDNENTTGAVYIDGKTWTARSEDGDVIARGSMVTIVRMEGVKLFVRKRKGGTVICLPPLFFHPPGPPGPRARPLLLLSSIHLHRAPPPPHRGGLGAYSATWNVGLHLKIPFIERVVKKVSLKEQVAGLRSPARHHQG